MGNAQKGVRVEKGKRILGVILICLSIGALFAWEKWGRNKFIYDDIAVLSHSVNRGTVITEEMLETAKIEQYRKGMVKPQDMSWLVGKEAGQYVRADMPLFKEYFDEEGLAADQSQDRHMLNVPENWIDSCPESLERGREACFYSGGRLITRASVAAVNSESKSFEVVASEAQVKVISRIAASGNKFVISYD